MLYLFTINVQLNQVKMFMFYNDQTTNLTFLGKKPRYIVNIYSNTYFQIVTVNILISVYFLWYLKSLTNLNYAMLQLFLENIISY